MNLINIVNGDSLCESDKNKTAFGECPPFEQHPAKIQILMLQPSSFCNINCSYCYLPDRSHTRRMELAVIERVAEQIVPSEYFVDKSLILWHAGEPLSVPLVWYREAVEILQRSATHPLKFQFQTNGTLLNDEWAAFLRDTGTKISLSIDGPAFIHDAHRKDRAGRGTFDRVMQASCLLNKWEIPYSCIATLTDYSLDYADEIFAFFNTLKPASVGFSVEESEGSNSSSSVYRFDCINRVERFFTRITELNLQSESLFIREVDNIIRAVSRRRDQPVLNQESQLGAIVSVGTDGTVAFFSPELLTTYQPGGVRAVSGNIQAEPFDTIFGRCASSSMADQVRLGVSNCEAECSYFRFCGGGSPANKFGETHRFDATETWHCRLSRKAVARGVLKAIGARASSLVHYAQPPDSQDILTQQSH